MSVTSRILGESDLFLDPSVAYMQARHSDVVDREKVETSLAKSARWSYLYAVNILKGRFHKGEPELAKHPDWAYHYAMGVIKDRWPEGESAIATGSWKDEYLKHFPETKDDWVLNGTLDWMDS